MPVVLIVEDHSLMADGLAVALEAEGFSVTIAPLTSSESVLATARAVRPAVALLDLDLGGAIGSGLDLVASLAGTGARVIVVSGTDSRADLGVAIESGASGVLGKDHPLAELVATVHAAAAGRSVLAESDRQALLSELYGSRMARRRELEPFGRLTPREQEVLRGLLDGRRADDLARSWSVSKATIRTQVRGVLTKLGVSSQLEAVAMASRVGWPPAA